jgi:replication-associated recombination protein RarA
MPCLPAELRGRRFYRPSGRGFERHIQERLEEIARARSRQRRRDDGAA